MPTVRAEYPDRLRRHLTANPLAPDGAWLLPARRLAQAWPGAATLTSAVHRPTVIEAITRAGLPDPADVHESPRTAEEPSRGYAAAAVLLAVAATLWSPHNPRPHLRNGPSVGHALAKVPQRHLNDDTLQRLLHLLLRERPDGLAELVRYLPYSPVARVDLMSVVAPAYLMAAPPDPRERADPYPDRDAWQIFRDDVRDLRPGLGIGDHGGPYLGPRNPNPHPHLRRSPRLEHAPTPPTHRTR
ncbi:hypothetical protein [Embleya hyalina]|uniref:Uncharacterized protein n=1 Tax=Embleya hyalina TaxID=516124 RepID=A0A401Z5R3_9ACTN|nr:hypothetical protein EHYA_09989 [Embleya hyalina]